MNPETHLIVGGSSGIGLGIVKRLSEAGANVVVLSRTKDALAGLNGVQHFAYDALADSVDPQWLPNELNGFAYCPGTINLKPFARITPETFRQDFELNVVGATRALQAALPNLKAAAKASNVPSRVLFFSTVAVAQGMSFHASVAASKGAIEGLTRSLGMELAPSIRVNCIAPSLTETPLSQKFVADEGKRKASNARHPLGRIGQVEDLVGASQFLLSTQSDWITGQVLGVDGGMSTLRKL